ncbi:MAG TPA: hypothetical protein VEI96_04350 [Thermodesulfovibrionales bacterium]|nr:hypothetical protein [Thermodesulfovibrionales bacterium]
MNYGDFVWYAAAAAVILCILGPLILLRHAEKSAGKPGSATRER